MDKYDVMAKCQAIITRQIAHTSNPNVREYLNEIADRLAEPGHGESYRLIKYSNCITLINDNYQDEVNFKLYDKSWESFSLSCASKVATHGQDGPSSSWCDMWRLYALLSALFASRMSTLTWGIVLFGQHVTEIKDASRNIINRLPSIL